jgi:bacterioferritin
MQGKPELIETLNRLLAEELTAINQYMVHSEMCENWGYSRLHNQIEKNAMNEMKHAESLIGRILFLEGIPVVSKLNSLRIGKDVPTIIKNDHQLELEAVASYNRAIAQAAQLEDSGTRELLKGILQDEEKHLDSYEAMGDQISQMGTQIFLLNQVRE